MKKIEKLEGTITATQPESKREKMPELEWNERGDFNRRVAEGTREFIKNSQPESKQGWRERFEQSFPNLEINMAVTDKLTGEKIKLEGLDVILLKDFISSEIAEAKRELLESILSKAEEYRIGKNFENNTIDADYIYFYDLKNFVLKELK